MQLPEADRAEIDLRKLRDYCLNPAHPRGRHKAPVFRAALGIGQHDAPWLRQAILDQLGTAIAISAGSDAWGARWAADVTLRRSGRSAITRTLWRVQAPGAAPRLISCYILPSAKD